MNSNLLYVSFGYCPAREYFYIVPRYRDHADWTNIPFKHKSTDPNYSRIFEEAWDIIGCRLGGLVRVINGAHNILVPDSDFGHVVANDECYVIKATLILDANLYSIISAAYDQAPEKFYRNSESYSPTKEDKMFNLLKLNSTSSENLDVVLKRTVMLRKNSSHANDLADGRAAGKNDEGPSSSSSSVKSSGEFLPPIDQGNLTPKEEKVIKKFKRRIQEIQKQKQKIKEEEEKLKKDLKKYGLI
nr:hypothetical protein K-LCC10_0096 [Kaumoebavirus]